MINKMIDGTQFTFKTENYKTHLLKLPCWEILVNEKSGDKVNDIRSANIRGLDIKLKPSQNGGFNLLVNGSLHKFYNCGEHNADQFSFSKLIQSVDSITDILGIDSTKCEIHGLEIGVNLKLPFPPIRVLKNVVCYRSKPFTQINKRNARKGSQCVLNQYSIKLYDKEEQSGIDCGNILRVEIAVSKMQVLTKYNISTLGDLQEETKVFPLVNILKDAIDGMVWTDANANLKQLTQRELKQWLYYSNPRSWQTMGKSKRSRAHRTWKELLNKYGEIPGLFPIVLDTWKRLFIHENEAEKLQPFYQVVKNNEALETATFLPLECTVKRLQSDIEINTTPNAGKCINDFNNISDSKNRKKRFCITCGKSIELQKEGSKFCSEKLYGKDAKKCRNKNSNNRRGIKSKLNKITNENVFLAVTYQGKTGIEYTDILHSSEISEPKDWIGKIKTVNRLVMN